MPSLTARLAVLIVAVAGVSASCARTVRNVQITGGATPALDELWQDPGNVAARDVFHGPGGESLLPRQTTFAFVAEDTTGYSPGFDVTDDQQRQWSVKTGPEAQSEVATSRILWAIGFHQPPTYYIEHWSLSGTRSGAQQPGRFRPEVAGREVVGDWPWHENPFVGSRPFGGLIVANLLLTSWDWKTSNNKVYQLKEPINGVQRWFVVRDLGASLGKFTYPPILTWFRLRGFGQGTRNDVADFEAQGFLTRIDRDRNEVEFDYRGIYRDVIDTVTPEDVRWACEHLSRLTDAQWRDAFRAAGYAPDVGARFVAKIKEKVAQGLQMTAAD